MSLAELVATLENGRLRFRDDTTGEEARRKLEWFAERNYLVKAVVEGRTTFAAEFDKAASNSFFKKIWPWFARTEDARTLEYLFTIPTAYKPIASKHGKLEKIVIPEDYYIQYLYYRMTGKSKMGKFYSASDIATNFVGNYIAPSFLGYVVVGSVAGLISETASAATGLGAAGLLLLATAFHDLSKRKRLFGNLRHEAELLDSLVQASYGGTANYSAAAVELAVESADVRHRRARQHITTAGIHFQSERYVEAAQEAKRAVQLAPLVYEFRRKLAGAYAENDQFQEAFSELREARVLFGEKVNAVDAAVSSSYYVLLMENGRVEGEESKVLRFAMLRAGTREVENVFAGLKGP